MKDDLVEQVSATIKRLTRAHAPATPEELARAILAIARPAILGEAAPEADGVMLRGLINEIGKGTRNFPPEYKRARVLVGFGLAEYDLPFVPGQTYWLRLTAAGLALHSALAHTTGQEPERTCPICAEPFKADDICATDINEGTCHAECLEGSPVVYLDTGEPSDGPVDTFRYGQEGGR